MINNMGDKLYRKKTRERIKAKVRMLGKDNEVNENNFLIVRLVLTIIIFGALLIFSRHGYILAPLVAIIFYKGVEVIVLDGSIKRRGKRLEKEALFFLEVLVLTLEGGRNLKQALSLTTENIDSEISLEFKRTLSEIKLGKSLNEALNDMKKRIPSDNINNVILSMVESNTYGNDITDLIYNQIEFLRNKQILEVKAEIAKLPTKISVISVLFFIPIMLLVILAPVLINLISK